MEHLQPCIRQVSDAFIYRHRRTHIAPLILTHPDTLKTEIQYLPRPFEATDQRHSRREPRAAEPVQTELHPSLHRQQRSLPRELPERHSHRQSPLPNPEQQGPLLPEDRTQPRVRGLRSVWSLHLRVRPSQGSGSSSRGLYHRLLRLL